MNNSQVGLDQIAEVTGLSKSTVSRALRGTPGISVHTTARVRTAASKLGYRQPEPAVASSARFGGAAASPSPIEKPSAVLSSTQSAINPVGPQHLPASHPQPRRRPRERPPDDRRTVGIQDVAERAGVSAATVSRALTAHPGVAADTRAKVVEAAAALGYVRSPIASALARGQTNAVGVLAPWVSRWFFGAVVEGLREVLTPAGFDIDIMLYPIDGNADLVAVNIARFLKQVDGLLRINVPPVVRSLADRDLHQPLVTIGEGIEGVAGVLLDDVSVGENATRHLLELGHRRIAFLGTDPDQKFGFVTAANRLRGYRQALRQAGVPIDRKLIKTTGFSVTGGEAGFRQLAEDAIADRNQLPTGIFAVSDEVAMGIIHAANRAGLRVPEDLSVIGIDNHDYAYLFQLTTIAQPAREQGRLGGQLLLQQMSGELPGAESITVLPELILRHTTAPPRR